MTVAVPLPATLAPSSPSRDLVLAEARRAARIVAPVWPLAHFVAVNPFLGLADRPFTDAATDVGALAGARLTMPRAYYAEAIARGRITDAHLDAAIGALRGMLPAAVLPRDAAAARAAAAAPGPDAPPTPVPTAADVVGVHTGLALARIVGERIAAWAASYFDAGQASGASPWRDLPAYGAWQADAGIDRTPELLGIPAVRAHVRALPPTADEAIVHCLAHLGVPAGARERYLQRLMCTIAGWGAWARRREWQEELHGGEDDTPVQLLAVRLAWELVLVRAFAGRGAREAWGAACAALAATADAAPTRETALGLVLQRAHELGYQEALAAGFASRADVAASAAPARPAAQVAFCIDVRSEIVRRHLEAVAPGVATIGFAGFFGFAIEYVPAGQARGGAQCPVLLAPSVVVAEVVGDGPSAASDAIGARRRVARWSATLWRQFRQGAVSCFGFVGPVGLAYARKLVTDSLGLTRPVPHPSHDGLDAAARAARRPTLALAPVADRAAGLAPADRLQMAATVLQAMSLTSGFARLVLLAGHGSTTVNNPHATGLDCGACGGHTGEANARVAALVLNDPDVRRGLAARGLPVPDDTHFLAGLHDTTTDDVTIFDRAQVPATHRDDLAALERALAAAARRARAERAPSLGLPAGDDVDRAVRARSRDWAQVRPEWGLAGCAAFIAAPRHRTAGLDLGGRAFLHSYDWTADRDFGVLELILTAPMVVASWIALQYHGSTVDNVAFGCGNKVLHNVVGTLGVLEGNGGDLRTGLPLQSVHDGTRFVHEPIRLTVVVEAPVEAMTAVLAKHAGVRTLLDHGWLHLWAMDASGRATQRYAGGLRWEALA